MYLSTPKGGGTHFADLGVTVPAVKGNAVVWPSVMNANPDVREPFRARYEPIVSSLSASPEQETAASHGQMCCCSLGESIEPIRMIVESTSHAEILTGRFPPDWLHLLSSTLISHDWPIFASDGRAVHEPRRSATSRGHQVRSQRMGTQLRLPNTRQQELPFGAQKHPLTLSNVCVISALAPQSIPRPRPAKAVRRRLIFFKFRPNLGRNAASFPAKDQYNHCEAIKPRQDSSS
eukprot:3581496-Pleurochrysis_carterae.AAC.3